MKRFKLVSDECASSANVTEIDTPKTDKQINWLMCILCQRDTAEVLQCPNDNKSGVSGIGYKSMAANLSRFHDIDQLPPFICYNALNEGGGIEATLVARCAKWHKSCRDKVNSTKLQRAEKRHAAISLNLSDDETSQASQPQCSSTSNFTARVTRSVMEKSLSCEPQRCFFCDEVDEIDNLHAASTFRLDRRVRHSAQVLQDVRLLAKLSVGDMMALEAKYHGLCLVNLYRKAKAVDKINDEQDESLSVHGLAFAQLVSYISEVLEDTATAPVFKLSELSKKYGKRLEELGLKLRSRVNSTKLKDRLLAYFPNMQAEGHGKHVLLVCKDDIGDALSYACQQSSDEDALSLTRAAQVVRRSMFGSSVRFAGSFESNCQESAIPQSLKALISMILEGPSIEIQTKDTSQAVLSISQLVMYNSVKYARKLSNSDTKTRHSNAVEAPLSLYLAMMLHSATRQSELVDKLFALGLCVNYDSLLQISADMANNVTSCFDLCSGLCPPSLCSGMFTTGAVDNIDHNPSSTTSVESFHGTAISLTQHGLQSNLKPPQINAMTRLQTKSIKSLPQSYTTVLPVKPLSKNTLVPKLTFDLSPKSDNVVDCALVDEYSWLDKVHNSVVATASARGDNDDGKPVVDFDSGISWSAFHASSSQSPSCVDKSTLLPLFVDNAHSTAMICHAMKIIQSATNKINPGQIPVVTADQPLFALAKQIQWNWPENFSENQYIIMFGALHIEMTALKTLGDWLEGSGWTSALVTANITTAGKADAMLHAAHVGRARHAHQLTAACLYILQQRAYASYTESVSPGSDKLDFKAWSVEKSNRHPQFQLWNETLHLELALLSFVRSIRQSNFALYIESLSQLVPWFFALDHHHYARWITVHLRDMKTLSTRHPEVAREFVAGKFTVHKTTRRFSAIALDHAHEQINARIKGAGGAIGLTGNPQALLRWMIAGPEVSRVIEEFETIYFNTDKCETLQHEQRPKVQSKFSDDVLSLLQTVETMGNPFLDDTDQVVALDTAVIGNASIVTTVKSAHSLGVEQFEQFVKERLVEQTIPFDHPIKRNKLPLFKQGSIRPHKSVTTKLQTVKDDCNLFARLYVACQTRDVSLDDFFMHENQSTPPSLSVNGSLRLGTKSDLMTCLEDLVPATVTAPNADMLALDGAAIVQMLGPGSSHTFEEYAVLIFVPYIKSQLARVKRIDLVWDQYYPDSLKSTTRGKRGTGVRHRVLPTTAIPKNWSGFLRVDENKKELFGFLSKYAVTIAEPSSCKLIVATNGDSVLTSCPIDYLEDLVPCSHEEADTRLLLHAIHAAKLGLHKIIIRTVDTDVVVLSISLIDRMNVDELWIAFGTGKNFRYLSIGEIRAVLGPAKSVALPFFHALTGCDTVSCFAGHGKKTAWQTWNAFSDVTPAFIQLAQQPQPQQVDDLMPLIERFVVLFYDRTSDKLTVNSARKHLFTKKRQQMEGLPPTQAALVEHVKRAAYQSGHCWYTSLQAKQDLPVPTDWGWLKVNEVRNPLWSRLPDISQSCPELISCDCKIKCSKGRCRCHKAALECTALCRCDGMCGSG